MRKENEIDLYLLHWSQFRKYCEQRAKEADCHINNKNWQKLKEFHLENYLKGLPSPFGFLFNIKMRHRRIYREIHCMPRFYYKYLKEREKLFDSPSRRVVEFPTWRKKRNEQHS